MNSWLAECRKEFNSTGARRLLRKFGIAQQPRFAEVCAGEEASPDAVRYYQMLLDGGRVVWGAIVQANRRAYMPGNDDLPAVVAFSPKPDLDNDPEALQDIAHRVFALRGQAPEEPNLARIARLISDETAEFHHERLPDSLSGCHDIYISTVIVNRRRLPTGRLTLQLFPLLVDPTRSPVVMILPLRYWARSLVGHWRAAETHVEENPNALADASDSEPDVARLLSQAEAEVVRHAYSENPLKLTPEAVMQVRQIIAECNLPSGVYLRILTETAGNRRERSMKFSVDPPDVSGDLRCQYEGFDLVTDIDSAANLTGVVLDFRKGIEDSGFVFRDA
jgi:Fe-S cluster assembly iron-binding protein IscA